MGYKKIFSLFLVLLALTFVLSGCKSQDIIDENTGQKIGEIKTTGSGGEKTTEVTVDLTENVGEGQPCDYDGQCGSADDMVGCQNHKCVDIECKFLSDCPASADMCYQHKCMTEAELYARFKQWTMDRMCSGTCDNCVTGKLQSAMTDGRDDAQYRICSDCMMDTDCKDGYWCDVGKCVSSEGGSAASAAQPQEEETPVDTEVGAGDPILGKWERGGFHYYFKENGDMMLEVSGNVKAKWEHVSGNKYVLRWTSHSYIDDVTLSDDGNLLEGTRRDRDDVIEFKRLE